MAEHSAARAPVSHAASAAGEHPTTTQHPGSLQPPQGMQARLEAGTELLRVRTLLSRGTYLMDQRKHLKRIKKKITSSYFFLLVWGLKIILGKQNCAYFTSTIKKNALYLKNKKISLF